MGVVDVPVGVGGGVTMGVAVGGVVGVDVFGGGVGVCVGGCADAVSTGRGAAEARGAGAPSCSAAPSNIVATVANTIGVSRSFSMFYLICRELS
jgi:hypothetical protein